MIQVAEITFYVILGMLFVYNVTYDSKQKLVGIPSACSTELRQL